MGSFESSRAARDQFAFLRAFKEEFAVEKVAVYDPVMTEEDRRVVERSGMTVWQGRDFDDLLAGLVVGKDVADNDGCDGSNKGSGGATLYFMPHCPRSLNERWLAVQISRGVLQSAVLVGNSPGDYALRSNKEGLLSWCAGKAKELRIVKDNSDPLLQAFAGMAVVVWPERLEPRAELIKAALDTPVSSC